MGYEQMGGALGYFFGRLDTPDELTIAFLAEREENIHGFASLLSEIGPSNLRISFEVQPTGAVDITVEDKRDPGNFQDKRMRPIPMLTRFLEDFAEDQKIILTVGDLELNMAYDMLRLEINEIEVKCSSYCN